MKKLGVLLLGFFLFFLVSGQPLKAQAGTVDVFFNSGIVTDDSFSFDPLLWTGGINLDFYITDYLTLSPECYIIIYQLEFDPIWIAPAILANLRFSSIFIGAGITKWFIVGEGYTMSTDFSLKMNAGFQVHHLRLTAFVVSAFDHFLKDMTVGATIGFGF